jgi:hypothetical protein
VYEGAQARIYYLGYNDNGFPSGKGGKTED